MAEVYRFGIRHHGPGCARSLRAALETLAPDCLLIEGPPEAESLLGYLAHPDMQLPVALLISNPEQLNQAAFYPFAEFSPEWQALTYAAKQAIPIRFMDLPVAHSFGLELEQQEQQVKQSEEASGGEVAAGSDSAELLEQLDIQDPLEWLARAAGFESGESWWNHLVEERQGQDQDLAYHLALFEAIETAMVSVRDELGERNQSAERARREALREAWMRKTLRQAQKDGFEKIALVCGAWHLPALAQLPSAKADNDLLKGLPKTKSQATWVPWSYAHLSIDRGYGAGVVSPQWYEHIWNTPDASQRGLEWLSKSAKLLRDQGLECSPAQVIDAFRLAESLAALRDYPQIGLTELLESLATCICMGEQAPLALIQQQLIVGERLGQVPLDVPSIPLQKDLEALQKSLRLKPDAAQKVLDLDLRQAIDLGRSQLLHRLAILDIPWGRLSGSGRSAKGSFHEVWSLQWEPEFALAIIVAGRWGNRVEDAASAKLADLGRQAGSLSELAKLLDRALLAELPTAIAPLSHILQDRAALSGDATELLASIPPLVQIARYGNVRNLDTQLVETLLQSLVPRAALALPGACQSLDEEAARELMRELLQTHQALGLLSQDELLQAWQMALGRLSGSDIYPGLISGLATRLLFEAGVLSGDLTQTRMSLALSLANPPAQAACWLEGFLHQGALVLLHDNNLWDLVNSWLTALSEDQFIQVLPLVRRCFGAFALMERRQLGERANQGLSQLAASPTADLDEARAQLPLPLIRQLLGIEA